METRDKAGECGRLALSKKAGDVVMLDLSGLTEIADFFVLASGTSERHVLTIAGAVEHDMKEKGVSPLSKEGYDEGRWIIIDYGDVVVHVFLEPLRELYDLESLWIEAKKYAVD
ncbi:MAG: ribosome silencing factor [Syntrophorhabdales bacterium]